MICQNKKINKLINKFFFCTYMNMVSFHAYYARIIEQISMHLICKLCQAQGENVLLTYVRVIKALLKSRKFKILTRNNFCTNPFYLLLSFHLARQHSPVCHLAVFLEAGISPRNTKTGRLDIGSFPHQIRPNNSSRHHILGHF